MPTAKATEGEPEVTTTTTRLEHREPNGLRHVSDAVSRRAGIAICSRGLEVLDDGGPVTSLGPRCMNCRDAVRRLDPATDDYRIPSAGAPAKES